jgi:hypothetical protein
VGVTGADGGVSATSETVGGTMDDQELTKSGLRQDVLCQKRGVVESMPGWLLREQ